MTLIDFTVNGKLRRMVGRKSLPRLFRMQMEFFDRPRRFSYTPVKLKNHKDSYLYSIKNQILASAKRTFLQGHNVEVYSSTKVSGIDCQISYLTDLKAFLICSDSNSILLRDKS